MDRNRIQYVARLPHGETLVNRALNDAEPLAVAQLVNRFGVQDMLTAPRDPDFLASLLYYFGVLTLAGRDALGKLQLAIPNQVIRKLYVERLQEQTLPRYEDQEQRQKVVERFYATGDLGPLCDLLEQTYFKVFDNRDLRWSNELVVKTAFLVVAVQRRLLCDGLGTGAGAGLRRPAAAGAAGHAPIRPARSPAGIQGGRSD